MRSQAAKGALRTCRPVPCTCLQAGGCGAGGDASEARELREVAPAQLRCHWLATIAQVARCVACVPCITAELREVALSCLADPCVRVRLCAAVAVPAIFSCAPPLGNSLPRLAECKFVPQLHMGKAQGPV